MEYSIILFISIIRFIPVIDRLFVPAAPASLSFLGSLREVHSQVCAIQKVCSPFEVQKCTDAHEYFLSRCPRIKRMSLPTNSRSLAIS